MPLRLTVDPELGFRQLVRATREVFFDALANADVPVDELSTQLRRTGDIWRTMLFRHLFNYVPGSGSQELRIGGRAARALIVENGFSKFDLELFVLSAADGITIRAVYGTELFQRADVTALLDRYEAALLALAADSEQPAGRLVLCGDRDREVIEAANATAAPAPASVLESVLATAASRPDAIALADGDRLVSYRQLCNAAAAVQRQLAASGVGPCGFMIAESVRVGCRCATSAHTSGDHGRQRAPSRQQRSGIGDLDRAAAAHQQADQQGRRAERDRPVEDAAGAVGNGVHIGGADGVGHAVQGAGVGGRSTRSPAGPGSAPAPSTATSPPRRRCSTRCSSTASAGSPSTPGRWPASPTPGRRSSTA